MAVGGKYGSRMNLSIMAGDNKFYPFFNSPAVMHLPWVHVLQRKCRKQMSEQHFCDIKLVELKFGLRSKIKKLGH